MDKIKKDKIVSKIKKDARLLLIDIFLDKKNELKIKCYDDLVLYYRESIKKSSDQELMEKYTNCINYEELAIIDQEKEYLSYVVYMNHCLSFLDVIQHEEAFEEFLHHYDTIEYLLEELHNFIELEYDSGYAFFIEHGLDRDMTFGSIKKISKLINS